MIRDEEIFLACILKDQSIVFKTILPEMYFIADSTRRVYRAMLKCIEMGIKIDYISVADMDAKIDPKYPVVISDSIPSAANWKYYESNIIKTYQRTKLIELGSKLVEVGNNDPIKAIEYAEKRLFELATNSKTQSIQKITDIMPAVIAKIEERRDLGGRLPGISSGLKNLDWLTGGFQDERYIVIGARPSDGKSALALNMACHIAIVEKIPVGFISAESSNTEIGMRILSSVGHIKGDSLARGQLDSVEIGSLLEVGERIKETLMYFYDAPNVRFPEFKSIARQMVSMHGCKILFVDYIQIIQWENQTLPHHEQVAEISKGIKQLARELKIPIVGLSQLKRDSEGREPEMADLDYSKQLEQDADTLIFIHHPVRKDGEREESRLLIKKNRDGAKGMVKVVFKREYVKFYEEEIR